MKYLNVELHNHTTESDGSLSHFELANYMKECSVDAFALTDHNTISGHSKMEALLETHLDFPTCLLGMEYTTYYGHILCPNLRKYISFENLNRWNPDQLFLALKKAGSLVGIAHPFSDTHPKGSCGFCMTIQDFNNLDFIEVINNSEPLQTVNKEGIAWWENLVLQGYSIACTAGMDLHNIVTLEQKFSTLILRNEDQSIEENIISSIRDCRCYVSRGPVLELQLNSEQHLVASIDRSLKPGFCYDLDCNYIVTLTSQKGTTSHHLTEAVPIEIPMLSQYHSGHVIAKLYQSKLDLEHLVCIAPFFHL